MIGRLAACALVALLAACGRFGATDDATDGTDASVAPGSDGGTDARDDGPPTTPIVDAGPDGPRRDGGDAGDAGTPQCEVPATGNVLSIAPGSPAVFVHKFSATGPIAHSVVDVDMTVTIGAQPWQSGAFFDLLLLGYGDGDDYTSLPVTQFTVTPTIDQDVWRHAGSGSTYYQYTSLSPMTLPSGTVTLHADVQWGDPGSISFKIDATSKGGTARTLDTTVTRQKVLTVEIGGNVSGDFPSHQIAIQKICVTFE